MSSMRQSAHRIVLDNRHMSGYWDRTGELMDGAEGYSP